MLNYIDWYIVELKLRLEKQIPSDRLATVTAEVESHLKESAKTLSANGLLSEEEAMRTAVGQFGLPDQIAHAYLRERNGKFLGVRPIWAVLGSALLAICSWNFAWLTMSGPFDHFGETWQNGIAALICFVSTILFVLACKAGRRLYSGPVALFGGFASLALVVLFSWWIIGADPDQQQGISRFHMARDKTNIQVALTRLDGLQRYFEDGAKTFGTATSAAEIDGSFKSEAAAFARLNLSRMTTTIYPVDYELGGGSSDGQFVIPHRSIFAMVDGRVYALEYAKDLASAKVAWKENYPVAMKELRVNQIGMHRMLDQIAEAQGGRLFYPHRQLEWPVIIQTLVLTFYLVLLDLLAFRLGRRRGTWPKRAFA